MRVGLRELLSAVAEEEETPKLHPIDERAQAMELRDRYRRAMVKTPFEPGALCREKRGMGGLTTARLVIFWRWLDPADTQDARIIEDSVTKRLVNRTDCVVGFLDRDGDLVITHYESWRLEPCNEFDAEAPP